MKLVSKDGKVLSENIGSPYRDERECVRIPLGKAVLVLSKEEAFGLSMALQDLLKEMD